MQITLRERLSAAVQKQITNYAVKHPRVLLWIARYVHWENDRRKRNHKCFWRCYRDGGGGQLITPKEMTEATAVSWVSRVANAEVFHVDFEHRMIFYRSAGLTRLTD